MKIDLTEDEISLAAYAIRELANRRQEQSIDARVPEMAKGCRDEAEKLRKLDNKLLQSLEIIKFPLRQSNPHE